MSFGLEHLTQLAALLAEAPIASLMLIKDDTLYCKSCVGISSEEIAQYHAVFTFSMAKKVDYDCILNIQEDERWHKFTRLNTLQTIQSYHSYHIKTKTGESLAILVFLKHEGEELTERQINGLQLLSKQVETLLELQTKNKALKKRLKQLKKTSKKADDFAAMAAHDLKAPVRNIKSFIYLLKSEQDWREDKALYFDYIDTSIAKMNLLIDGLMDYAISGRNRAQSEAVNLDVLVNKAFKDSTTGLGLSSVNLIKEPLPVIYSHPILLPIAIYNLIHNAIKYHKTHPIDITVVYKAENGYHYLGFSDHGIGINPAHFNEIFKPFKRLHTQSEFKGSGLGLATCKRIIKHLKGNISVSSQAEQGSTFTIKLPIIEKV